MSSHNNAVRMEQATLLADLLQRIGYAVWQAAECEDTLAHYLVLRTQATKGMGAAPGEELLTKARKRTFGQIFTDIKDKGVVDAEIETRLTKLLEERNWLVHRSKRENRGVLNDPVKLEALNVRLDFIGDEATRLNTLIARTLEAFVVSQGVDQAWIDAEAAKLQEAWGYNLP